MSVVYRPVANEDIDEIAIYLNAQRVGVGTRFLNDLHQAATRLAVVPGMGRVHAPPNPKLPGLRVAVLQGWRYLIFYLPTDGGMDVVRVLHSSRDTQSIIAAEE